MNQIKQLKQIRKDRGISFEVMSRDIGVSARTLFRWIHELSEPSLMGLTRIQEYLDRQAARVK